MEDEDVYFGEAEDDYRDGNMIDHFNQVCFISRSVVVICF